MNQTSAKPSFLQKQQELPKQQEETKEEEKEVLPEKAFRVTNFAYQFKTGAPTPLVAVNNIYTPRSEQEKAFLEHQVKQGRVDYK